MIVIRLTQIAWAGFGLAVLALRQRGSRSSTLPERLCATLQRLGPTFVKAGQALSLRQDILPAPYAVALQALQDQVAAFPGELAIPEVERALGRPIDEVFAEFETAPFAAASIAQVHKAVLHNGDHIIVKVRRPGIDRQIEQDMRALLWAVRLLVGMLPRLRRFEPLRIVEEVWANLRKETDFRQEARNIRRFMEAFAGSPTVHIPALVDDLYGDSAVVQEFSSGLRIDDPKVKDDGPRLALAFVEAYLHQFFVLGVFHGDPHPGNLFITAEGRICFHDFGLVGFLDRATRRNLATFTQAFIQQDADWLLDAAVDLGVLGGELDRAEFRRGIEEILADYAALPLKDWSLAEALLRVARLGQGRNIAIPYNLLVLMRAMFEVEYVVRTLDPDFMLLDTLLEKGAEMLKTAQQMPAQPSVARLKHETVLTMQDVPAILGSWLHRMQGEGHGLEIGFRHRGLHSLEEHLDRSSNRVALALVTLGLYVAASLLMQHSIGPRLYGEMPVLAALGYGLALWFTWRLARSIARSGRL